MANRTKIYKVLGTVIIILAAILVLINVLLIKLACTNRQCVVINVSTIALLIWAVTFWLVVLRYSKKDKE